MNWRHLILRNFWVKMLSLTLATVIWFSIRNSIQADLHLPPTTIISPVESSALVPINVMAQPGDGRIFKVTPKEIQVTIRGESAVLRKYTPQDFKAYVDLSAINLNEPVGQEIKVHVPNGVTVLKIIPEAVSVEQISP